MTDPNKLAERCIYAALAFSIIGTILFWGSWWYVLASWVALYPMALFFGVVMGFVGAGLGWKVEDPQVWAEETEDIIVECSPEIVGKFQDADIHEWVMLKRPDNGEVVRCIYDRTVDMQNFDFEPPNDTWFCVVPPGILYIEDAKAKAEHAVQAAIAATKEIT